MGLVLEIKSIVLHNGPGIRTAVYLKGCPLRCEWCNTPESFNKTQTISYDFNKCTQCMDCVGPCPTGTLANVDGQLQVDHSLCILCGKCLKVCPTDALSLYGKEMSAEQVINAVLKDKPYFDKSGGGITLTGGEAFTQQHFSLKILQLSKKAGLHTAVETSGYTQQNFYDEVLQYVDLFLFDFKIEDNEKHKKYTGQGNELILSNLKYLDSKRARIILRCPIIPGVNDNHEHFESIARISNEFNSIEGVELIPYDDSGEYKYEQIGLPKPQIKAESISDEKIAEWLAILIELECKDPILA